MTNASAWENMSALGGTRTPNLLIRRSGRIVQDRPLRSLRWADIPQLSAWDAPCPAAWQQCWQQSRRRGTDPRPSPFRPDISQVGADHASDALSPVAAVGWCCCCHIVAVNSALAAWQRSDPRLAGDGPRPVRAGSCLALVF